MTSAIGVDAARPKGALARLLQRKLAVFGLVLITVVLAGAVFAPLLAPFPPDMQNFDGLTIQGAPMPPGGAYPMGTDLLGRDLFSRILYGARTSLIIGVVANGLALLIGTLVGITAGYFRGWIGAVLMRFTDLMMAFPALLLAICLAAIFSPSLWIVALVIALVNWVQTARVIYTETTSLAERDFIAAERTLGAGTGRILFRHILPHLIPTIIVWGTLGISTTVLLEATLSFLGVGVQPPTPSWGNIIFENQTYFQSAPWLVFIPGAAIILLALAFNLVGDALRDVLDPTQRGARVMAGYILRRLIQSALILLGVAFVTFFLLFVLPADPVRQIAGRSATAETVENIRQQLGLDKPFLVQFGRYLGGLVQGDLGRSYLQKSEVSLLIASRLPATLLLMVAAIFCELVIGLSMGIIAALRRDRFTDQALMMTSFVTVSAPQFVVSLLMLYVFSVKLGWFPIGGYGTFRHLVLPAITLGILGSGWYSRMMRSSMIDVMRTDYIRTARAKGLTRARVVLGHALPNAILPIIAMIGIDIGVFMGGIVVVESVFGWPGIGQLAWQAIQRIDIPIIMGVTLVSAVAIVLGNLLADVITPFIDPRIRLR